MAFCLFLDSRGSREVSGLRKREISLTSLMGGGMLTLLHNVEHCALLPPSGDLNA